MKKIAILFCFASNLVYSQLKIGSNTTNIYSNSYLEIESISKNKVIVTKDSSRIGVGTLNPSSSIDITKGYLTISIEDTSLQKLIHFRSKIALDSVSDWTLYKSDDKAKFSGGAYYPQGLHLFSYPKNGNAFGSCCNSRLTLLDNGKVGLGMTTPKVKLDIRVSNQNAAIGIGYTSQAANQAGEGAIRYNPIDKIVEFSDGIKWNNLLKPKIKSIVSGYFIGSNYPDAYYGNLNAVEEYDSNNDFNPLDATFLVPRTGIYTISGAIATSTNQQVQNGSYWELQVIPSITQSSKAVWFERMMGNSFIGTIQVSGSATILLQAGETVSFMIFNGTGDNKSLGASAYNRFSIVEHQD